MKIRLNEMGMKHINHPYDILGPEELVDFVNNLFSGNLVATEKVDGLNIYFAVSNEGNVVFARSKTEELFSDVFGKFSETHPGYDAFNAGLIAITEGFKQLSAEELENFSLTLNGEPNNFINAEIIYGEVPNLIPYSKLKNYIVFHSFNARKEKKYGDPIFRQDKVDQRVLLNKLANRLGLIKIKSNTIKFFGKPRKVEKEIVEQESRWEFRGPITVDLSNIKNQLDSHLQTLRGEEAYRKLYDHVNGIEKLDKKEQAEVSKKLVALAGNKILGTLKSALADPDVTLTSGHPGIEGLVFQTQTSDLQNHIVKITGDFAQLNQDAWQQLRETIPAIKKRFTGAVLEQAFGVRNLITLTDASFRKYQNKKNKSTNDVVAAFLKDRSEKYKNLEHLIDNQDIVVFNTLKTYANNAINDLDVVWLQILANPESFGNKVKDVKKSILISAYQFNEFLRDIQQTDTVAELFVKTLQHLYPIKFIMRGDVLEASSINDYEASDESSKRIGIFIGKFDPAHIGHIAVITNILEENDKAAVFVSKEKETTAVNKPAKHYLPYDEKIKILEKYLKSSKLHSNVKLMPMDTGFIPDLIKNHFAEDVIKHAIFTIYVGKDRENEYERQFRRFDVKGKAYWEYDINRVKFSVLPRALDEDAKDEITGKKLETGGLDRLKLDKILSYSMIPVNLMSSSLLRLLVKSGTDDAYRLFLTSQPISDPKFITDVWNKLSKVLGVNNDR